MINEIAMMLMFAALFILVLSAILVGSRIRKKKIEPAPETVEEAPKEPPKKLEPRVEERPLATVKAYQVSADAFEDEKSYQYAPEPELFMPEETVEIPGLELEEPRREPEFVEPEIELPSPEIVLTELEIEESLLGVDEGEPELNELKVVSPEPVLFEAPRVEEPIITEMPSTDTYREPDYFRDEDVIPIQGVTKCPHCGEKVPATIYCINCGKSLDG